MTLVAEGLVLEEFDVEVPEKMDVNVDVQVEVDWPEFMRPMFSIVLPVFNYRGIDRAIRSALAQTYDDFELVIVDDGCTDGTELIIASYRDHPKVRIIKHEKRMERLISRNDGMRAARGIWIQPLDRDDELASIALECWAYHIHFNPQYSLMNCAALMHDRKMMEMPDGSEKKFYFWSHVRQLFQPRVLEVGHEHFESGRISTGQFIFKKECLDEADAWFPEGVNPYQFADVAGIPGYDSKTRSLGNPWGDDFFQFWKLSRVYHSLPVNLCLYYQHIR